MEEILCCNEYEIVYVFECLILDENYFIDIVSYLLI